MPPLGATSPSVVSPAAPAPTLIENVVTSLAYQELHTKNKKLFTTSKEETEARNAVKDSLKDYYKTFAKDIQAIKDEY